MYNRAHATHTALLNLPLMYRSTTMDRPEIDHKNYPKRLRTLTDEQLRGIILDATDALQAMPDNPKAGYYADEVSYCAAELRRRKLASE